jgi:hypothetical protein
VNSTLTIIRWRDIPAQVVASQGRTKARVELSQRFQMAIDRAAMNAGLFGTDDYLNEWSRSSRPCGDDLDAEARSEAERLEHTYDRARLERLVAASGVEEET